jgi:hypothetical protein
LQVRPGGGVAIVDPGNFAVYVFTIVAAVGSVSIIGAVARRIAGPRGARRVHVLKDGSGSVIVGTGDPDPGSQDAVRQLTAELDAMRDEITGLRREMDETLNRLDFTERLLAQAKERGLLNAPREGRRE